MTGTIKNCMAHLRWRAEKVGKMGVIPKDYIQLGIESRQYVSEVNKAQSLTEQQLAEITDPSVRMNLLLQQEFSLRREVAIKFQPAYADKGYHILLKGSWTKGGRERVIPILTKKKDYT